MRVSRHAGGNPQNRLSRLTEAMCAALDEHPERGAERVIVFVSDPESGLHGTHLHGYQPTDDRDLEAMTDLLMHVRAIFKASGVRVDLVTIGDDGVRTVPGD